MRLNRLQASLAILALAVCCGTGCGGFQTRQSVSPASFFLPGFFGSATTAPAPAVSTALEPATQPAATE